MVSQATSQVAMAAYLTDSVVAVAHSSHGHFDVSHCFSHLGNGCRRR
jgi:hypothetical protein